MTRRGTAQHARISERQRVRTSRRDLILAAAVEIVTELGYREITVTQIADRAGISRETFYEHFEDREGCLVAAFDQVPARGFEGGGAAGGKKRALPGSGA
jgi:AcrR family transcriptional regulator